MPHFHPNCFGILACLFPLQTDLEFYFCWNQDTSNFPSNQIWKFTWSGMRTYPIFPQTDLTIHFCWNEICPISIKSDMNIPFSWNLDIPHFQFPTNPIWKFMFFAISTFSISFKSDMVILFFRNLDMFHFYPRKFGNWLILESWHNLFPPNQIWQFTFSGLRTYLISSQTDLEIYVFWNLDMFYFHPNRFWNSPLWNPNISHFHQHRSGNSLFLKSCHTPFPPKSVFFPIS